MLRRHAENGQIAAQKILACVAVLICMCVPIVENNVRVACCGACWWLRSADNEAFLELISKLGPCLPAQVNFIPGVGGRGGVPLNYGTWRSDSPGSLLYAPSFGK